MKSIKTNDKQLDFVRKHIKHVFVLMLENRSFDHMLGFSDLHGKLATDTSQTVKIDGIDPAIHRNIDPDSGNVIAASDNATASIQKPDPGHEFADVLVQLTDDKSHKLIPGLSAKGEYPTVLNNKGFVRNFLQQKKYPINHETVMQGFNPQTLPVLHYLAEEYAVCDNWFSSVPGPTVPNRFFMHAASSGGLDDSPSTGFLVNAELIEKRGFSFDNGTIFDRLSENGKEWRIYRGNNFPLSVALKGIRLRDTYQWKHFEDHLQDPDYNASYTFIEPDYGHFILGNYVGGNSQHPLDNVHSGEQLIKETYDILSNSPIWNESVLIVTYDEHGGFYDHAIPPSDAPDPGDSKDYSKHGFNFCQYGVRVPAVIISPRIDRNLIDQTKYDHTSVLATIEKIFDLDPLTQRDAKANDFMHLFTLDTPRKLSSIPFSVFSKEEIDAQKIKLKYKAGFEEIENAEDPIDSSLATFVFIAALNDIDITEERKALIVDKGKMFAIDKRITADENAKLKINRRVSWIQTRGEAVQYLKEVDSKIE